MFLIRIGVKRNQTRRSRRTHVTVSCTCRRQVADGDVATPAKLRANTARVVSGEPEIASSEGFDAKNSTELPTEQSSCWRRLGPCWNINRLTALQFMI